MRLVTRLLVLLAALTLVATASANETVGPPAVAIGGARAVVAWPEGGFVRVATRRPDGSFGGGLAVGRELGARPPRLAIATDAAGDEALVWQSSTILRSAFRAAGASSWTIEDVPGSQGATFFVISLVVDPAGRAILAWEVEGLSRRAVSIRTAMHPAGGSWSSPTLLARDANGASLALDPEGDAVLTYATRGVWTHVLPFGAVSFDPAVSVSGSDTMTADRPVVAGGGGRSFVVTWFADNPLVGPGQSSVVMRSARLRLPGSWGPPAVMLEPRATHPNGWDATNPLTHASALDPSGNASFAWQFPTSMLGYAIATSAQAASSAAWSAPTVLDQPAGLRVSDSRPSVAYAEDGTGVLAFVRRTPSALALRVATTGGGPDPSWSGAQTDAARFSGCLGARRCSSTTASPVVALAEGTAVIAVPSKTGVVVVGRTAPDAAWSPPAALEPVGHTTVALAGPRVVATCALPPCRGTVEVLDRGRRPRVLGRLPVVMRGLAAVSSALPPLPAGRVKLVLELHLRDDTTQRVTGFGVVRG